MTKYYINNLVFICNDTQHVRAHLSSLIDAEILPSHVIYIKSKIPTYGTINRFKYTIKKHLPFLHRWYRKLKKLMNFGRYSKGNSKYSIKLFGRDLTYETTLSLLNEANIPFETIYADDINDPSIINKLEMLSCRYVVVCHNNSRDATGNRNILRKRILNTNKSFINIHKGIVPSFRGSSATLWAMLVNKKLYGATVHFINEGIDAGPVIRKETFTPPFVNSVSQIGLYEAHMISKVLTRVIVDLHTKKELNAVAQDMLTGTTYFRMHPILNELSRSKQLRNPNIDKHETDHKNWTEKLKNNFKMHFHDSRLEFISDVELHKVLRKSLNDENIKDSVLKESFLNLSSILEPGYIFNEQDISFFDKQINVGWNRHEGIKQSSIVYLLSDTSTILLNSFLIILYQKFRDLRLLNTSFKLNDVMKNIYYDSLCINAYRLMFRIAKEQLSHLNDLKDKSKF